MLTLKQRRSLLRIIFAGSLTILTIASFLRVFFPQYSLYSVHNSKLDKVNSLNKSFNSTLGFDHIYVINLAKRPDRLRVMKTMTDALGLEVEFFTAVSTDDHKTLNRFNNSTYLKDTHKACYISHYLIYASIVSRGYDSALILEDDVDIELNITSIMSYIHSVLPNDWDLLYLGHCMNWEGSFFEPLDDSSPIFKLYPSKKPYCTHAYAVSYAGALKLLKELSVLEVPVDLELISRIDDGIVTSYSIEPAIVVQWRSDDNPSDVSPDAELEHKTLLNSTLNSLGFSWK
ncbi:4207_t:CDS:1 [Cetraspora pellucida]|uniref:4207_t:CDS:1 n=1 Tax=Cetraspora pellucida TaxID=1433469 RepID=A0ACA9MUZ5_9GLOM|nr:4207_t:CDS:1 [Cetraspora pellucida]